MVSPNRTATAPRRLPRNRRRKPGKLLRGWARGEFGCCMGLDKLAAPWAPRPVPARAGTAHSTQHGAIAVNGPPHQPGKNISYPDDPSTDGQGWSGAAAPAVVGAA